jgi:START domain-containing protein
MNKTGIFLILFLFSVSLFGQNKWSLKKEKDGIKIYTRHSETSAFNDIQVEVDLPGTIEQLYSILWNVAKYTDWAYSTKSCMLIKQINDNELIYYAEFDVPWPLSNRDLCADVKMVKDTLSHSLKVVSVGVNNFVPEKKGIVRVKSKGNWIITSLPGKRMMHLNYILELQPGGSAPAWIINLFSTKGPMESFQNLKQKMTALNK